MQRNNIGVVKTVESRRKKKERAKGRKGGRGETDREDIRKEGK